MEVRMCNGRQYIIYPPKISSSNKQEGSLVVIHGDEKLVKLLDENKILPLNNSFAVIVLSKNKLDDYTPWFAEAINERFPNFGGKADAYISWISNNLMPDLKNQISLHIPQDNIGILGQSLGGLLNMYLYCRDVSFWNYAICISPSSWYPNFLDYLKDAIAMNEKKKWYISSGLREGVGHQDIKSETVNNTKKILEFLSQNGHDVEESWDDGQHHDYLADRYYKALSWFDSKFL